MFLDCYTTYMFRYRENKEGKYYLPVIKIHIIHLENEDIDKLLRTIFLQKENTIISNSLLEHFHFNKKIDLPKRTLRIMNDNDIIIYYKVGEHVKNNTTKPYASNPTELGEKLLKEYNYYCWRLDYYQETSKE